MSTTQILWGVSFPISGPAIDFCLEKLVGVAGFEPATPSSRTSVPLEKFSVYWRV
jgi:hypothetical protein